MRWAYVVKKNPRVGALGPAGYYFV